MYSIYAYKLATVLSYSKEILTSVNLISFLQLPIEERIVSNIPVVALVDFTELTANTCICVIYYIIRIKKS